MVVADRDGVQRVSTYGFSDRDLKAPVKEQELFQIGSISKSFAAICALQLSEEGKLDLHRPITEYLPWFRIESSYPPITTHHVLTHSSGLPGGGPVFLSDPAARHRATYAPGQYFHYNNMCFELLGFLVWTLDGRPAPEAIRARIFEPLGMTASAPAISFDIRARSAKSYAAFLPDRPYGRYDRLCEAPAIVLTAASGCIAATAHDMGLYLQMLANHGRGPKGRLLSEESFALFSKPHIKAEEFGPTASYGYGIAVDTLDGHQIVRHTGGMVSFASALHVDIDEGVGAFASINAMQGYRPNPPVQYAIQLMRAQREGKPLPSAPPLHPPATIESAGEYAGTYQSRDGARLEFVAEGSRLSLIHKAERVPVETVNGGPGWIARHPDFERFALVFARADEKDPKSAVVEVGWGPDWYVNSRYSGPREFDYPKVWESYVGHYRNDSPWLGSTRIVLRKGVLMVDGVVPLAPLAEADGMFYLRDEEHSPEWVRFGAIVNGKAMHAKFSGEDLWRVAAE
jgi:CubicO group peptidase (beta-lactamase class C family)